MGKFDVAIFSLFLGGVGILASLQTLMQEIANWGAQRSTHNRVTVYQWAWGTGCLGGLLSWLLFYAGPFLNCLIFPALMVVGIVKCVRFFAYCLKGNNLGSNASEKKDLPRFQFWVQDLIITSLVYGLTLLPVFTLVPDTWSKPLLFLYFVLSSVLGFWIAGDIFRRLEKPLAPAVRGLQLALILFGSNLALPMSIMAWNACRHAFAMQHAREMIASYTGKENSGKALS